MSLNVTATRWYWFQLTVFNLFVQMSYQWKSCKITPQQYVNNWKSRISGRHSVLFCIMPKFIVACFMRSRRNALYTAIKGGTTAWAHYPVACVSVCVLIVVTSGATKRALHAGLGDADHVATTIERVSFRVARRRSPSLDDVTSGQYGIYRYDWTSTTPESQSGFCRRPSVTWTTSVSGRRRRQPVWRYR